MQPKPEFPQTPEFQYSPLDNIDADHDIAVMKARAEYAVTQAPPIDLPTTVAIDRMLELQRFHDERNARRARLSGLICGTADFLRNNPPEKLSTRMKDTLLNDIVRYADEFLEGR